MAFMNDRNGDQITGNNSIPLSTNVQSTINSV